MQVIINENQGGAVLHLSDAIGAPLDLTGVTEVRFMAFGVQTVGPIVCTVMNALAGVVHVPLDFLLSAMGRYRYEIEARWGTTRISMQGKMDVTELYPPTLNIIQDDIPVVTITVPNVDLQSALSIAVLRGATVQTATATISGLITVVAPDTLTIAFAAADTATVGRTAARLLVDGVSSHVFYINIAAQVII